MNKNYLASLIAVTALAAEPHVDRNVVYGMHSGLALLMDVHYPEKSNGRGVIFVAGSGWHARPVYNAPQLKQEQITEWKDPFLEAGYTIFTINHRGAPQFHYPAAVEDVQRAVRFVRHNAAQYSVDPAQLGGIGGSSGGHLIALTAMLGAPGIEADPDPVNRRPATLQCVILRAAPVDLMKMIGATTLGTAAVVSFLGHVPMPNPEDQKVFREASPVTHISSSAPPVLLVHGDADDTVPVQQSISFEAALKTKSVPVKLMQVPGGAHGHTFSARGGPHVQLPEVLKAGVAWLDQYLKPAAR